MAEAKETKITKYQSNGQDVELSNSIVRQMIVRGNKSVTDAEISSFIAICKYNALNPFLNEAYLIKYGEDTQMIVSKEALFKRAEVHPQYDGIVAGIIACDGDGNYSELEGCFLPKGAELVGAWAKVFRKDRRYPIVAKVNLSEYDTKKSIWSQKKSTMIVKVTKSQALREAFPADLGAMYIKEEQNISFDEEMQDDLSKQGSKKVDIKAPFEDDAEIIED